MPFSYEALGPLSKLAAAYIREMPPATTGMVAAELRLREAENDVVAAALVIKRSRANRIPLTDRECELVKRAEAHVKSGIRPPAGFAHIPRSDQRTHRTMLSLADPGLEHLRVTLTDPDLLDGVIVHHEVISRSGADGVLCAEIAPYRAIDIRLNGLLRLYAGDDVPVTVYGGRPSCQLPAWDETAPAGWTLACAYRLDPLTPVTSRPRPRLLRSLTAWPM